MNRRDALKTFAAVAAGGSLPVVAASPSLMDVVFRIPCQYMHATDMQCFMVGKEVVKWLTPRWQQRYWNAEFSEQTRIEKLEIAARNARIKERYP